MIGFRFNQYGTTKLRCLSMLCYISIFYTTLKRTRTVSAFHIDFREGRRQTSFSNTLLRTITSANIEYKSQRYDEEEEDETTFNVNLKNDRTSEKRTTKTHYTTICLVPSPNEKEVWDRLTNIRTELRDPGLFRWPPHVNLLYPFISIKRTDEEKTQEIFETLYNITTKYEPFQVTLDTLGCFGNKQRGVIWLHPRCSQPKPSSTTDILEDNSQEKEESDILQRIQKDLQSAFPMCHEQSKGGKFTPHMTLTHFPTLSEANNAKSKLEADGFEPITFTIKEIYLLKRFEADGQFLIYAKLPLGKDEDMELYETNAQKFPYTPRVEEHWVYEERMKLKERRRWPRRRRKVVSR